MSDPWEDEGFGADDDWAGEEGLVGDPEDDALAGLDDPDDGELDDAELDDDTGADEGTSS